MTGQNKKVYGEGNYEASKQYNDATKKFIDSGRVEAAAQAARPSTPQEAAEMAAAEVAGKNRRILHVTKPVRPAKPFPPASDGQPKN